jgi:hemolysin activation/secretion protein
VKSAIKIGLLICLASLPLHAQSGEPGVSPGSGANARMAVQRFELSGAGAMLTQEEFRALVAPFEGRDLAVPDLQRVTQIINESLKNKGYFLARVLLPAQEIQGGIVRLELLPGNVSQIKVEGNEHYSSEFIQEHIESVLGPNREVTEEDLQRQLLILNDQTDLAVTALFQPGAEKGQTDLTLSVKDGAPIHGGIGYDNFGNKFTDVHRASPYLNMGNLLHDGDNLAFKYLLGVPDNRANFLQASYSTPIDLDGSRLGVSYANGASTLGQDLRILDIRGRANIYSINFSHPLERTETNRQDLSVSYSYKEFDNSLLGLATGQDRYHALRLGYSLDFADPDGRTLLNTAFTQGLGGTTLNAGLGRSGASSTFTKINLDSARVQSISDPLFLLFRASGQWSPGTLFAAEQFALGGIDSVRGFNQGQFLGDVGYTLSAEARWMPWESRRDIQLAAFFDHGSARVINPQPGQLGSQSLFGGGVGMRFSLGDTADFRLDVGWPISPSTNFNGDSPVFYGQVQTHF